MGVRPKSFKILSRDMVLRHLNKICSSALNAFGKTGTCYRTVAVSNTTVIKDGQNICTMKHQDRNQVLRLGGKYILGMQDFCFYYMFKIV